MVTIETIALGFARCVNLFRDPGARKAQEAELGALAELLEVPLTLRPNAGGLEVNGVACEGEGLAGLAQRLDLHGVSAIALPANPPLAQLFEVVSALADQPGMEGLGDRLRRFGVDRIHVTMAGATGPDIPTAETAASRTLGTDGILRGEALLDIASVPLSGVPLVTHDPPPPPAAEALPGHPGALPPDQLVVSHSLEEQLLWQPRAAPRGDPAAPPRMTPAGTPPVPMAPMPPISPMPPFPAMPAGAAGAAGGAAPPLADPLAELRRNPAAPNVDDVLAQLIRQAEEAFRSNKVEVGLSLLLEIARCEERVPEGSSARRHYAIALRRVATRPVLKAVAELVTTTKYRDEAMLALQRAGAAGVDVLFDMLVAAASVSERRAYFDALAQMKRGLDQLIHAVDHPEWFVVRNVAELLGELGMEDAVPALGRQLGHPDERVRKAVALALAKIGTRSAAEPLARALRDKSPEVRMQVALGIGGPKSAALAMPLVAAMAEERDSAVERELILALGRIGSPDAVQALIKCSQPARGLFRRKRTEVRLAAVEALRLAATPAAVGTLEGLCDDTDKDVRAAAQAAHAELRPPRG